MVFCLQLSDGMELLLVSILGPILLCEWQLESWQEAIITTVSSTSLSMGFLVVHSNWPSKKITYMYRFLKDCLAADLLRETCNGV